MDEATASWYLISDKVVEELREAFDHREKRGDSPNAGDVQRAHLRVQKAMEALAAAVVIAGKR
jgi:hypothetical protein